MNDKIMECLTNPIKCKLILEANSAKKVTAKYLADTYPDIPQATLYRYLKRMTEDGIFEVVEENQVRGTVEKTYALAVELSTTKNEILENLTGDSYMQMFRQYIFGFVKQFQDYCKKPSIDVVNDKSGFSLAPIYATDDELMSAMAEVSKILTTLFENKPNNERKFRTIGLIISPPEKA